MIEIDRGDFLRLGRGLLAGALVPATAQAQLAKPAPQDDDQDRPQGAPRRGLRAPTDGVTR